MKHGSYKLRNGVVFLFIVLFFVLVGNPKTAKAEIHSITFGNEEERYYFSDEQYQIVVELFQSNRQEELNAYLESLGDTIHHFGIENGELLYCADETATTITVPDGVTAIGERVFVNFTNVTSITLPDSITKIDYAAFYGCTSLKKINLPSNLVSIGESSFSNCSSLISLTLPSSVTTIGESAFFGCTKLNKINLPPSIVEIGDYAFYDCTSLHNIIARKGSYAQTYATDVMGVGVTFNAKPALNVQQQTLLAGKRFKIWVYNKGNYSVSFSSSNTSVAKVSKTGVVTAVKSGSANIYAKINGKKLTLKLTVVNATTDNAIQTFVTNCTTADMSDYEIIKAAHSYLIQNVKYDYNGFRTNSIASVCHTAKGALVNGLAVCDGYANAFLEIMNYFNIPCKIVVGEGLGNSHAWNVVKIKDYWYQIDVTFDDPIISGSNENTTVFTTYFLKTDDEIKVDHSWRTSDYPSCTMTRINQTYSSER